MYTDIKNIESLRLIRKHQRNLSIEYVSSVTKIDIAVLSRLERGEMHLTPYYYEKLYRIYQYITYISLNTYEIFDQWKKEVLLSFIRYDRLSKNKFKECPVPLSIIERSPLYVDYKVVEFVLFHNNMELKEIKNLKKCLLKEDEVNYFLFQLFYASYLNNTREYEESYKVYKKIKPVNELNLLAMYYYLSPRILDDMFYFQQSLESLEKAEELFQKLGYRARYYFCKMAKGITLVKLNRFEESTQTYFETLKYFKDQGLTDVEYSTVCNIEWNYLLQGKYDEAWETIKYFPENCDRNSFYYFIHVIYLYKKQMYDECLKYIDLCIELKDQVIFNKRYSDLIRNAIKYGENYRYESQSEKIFEKLLDRCEYSNARFVALQLYEHYSKKQDHEQKEKWYKVYKSDNIKKDGLEI